MILALAALFLGDPPWWMRAAGDGAGAAVAAVAVQAGVSLMPAGWKRAASRRRWIICLVLGALAAAVVGPWVVVVLILCGAVEVVAQRAPGRSGPIPARPVMVGLGAWDSLARVALKVGALSYGGSLVVRAFLDGAGPAAIGAILGSAVPLVRALEHPWQNAVLAGAAALIFALRRGPVLTLVLAGATGVLLGLLQGSESRAASSGTARGCS